MVRAPASWFAGLAASLFFLSIEPAKSQDPPTPTASPAPNPDAQPRPAERLKALELKLGAGSTWLLFKRETSFLKDLRDARSIAQEVAALEEQQQAMDSGAQDMKSLLENLREHSNLLSQRIAEINQQLGELVEPPGGNRFVQDQRSLLGQEHNRLATNLNQVNNRINSLQGQDGEQLKDLRLQLNAESAKTREHYIQSVLDLRKLADEIQSQYSELAKNPEVSKALAELSSSKAKHKLGPSKEFMAALKQLGKSESSVVTDSVEVTREGGVSHVSVMLNGKLPVQMVYDTGASYVTISSKLAAEAGLKPRPDGPAITLETADGSKLKAPIVTLPSVRVGKVTLRNVACAVMPAEKGDVPSLLGQSFLEHVDHKLTAGHLELKKLDSGEPPASKATARAGRASKSPKAATKSRKSARPARGRQGKAEKGAEATPDTPSNDQEPN